MAVSRSKNLVILSRQFGGFRKKAVTAIEFGLDMLVAGMKNRAPIKTGRLRRSIRKTKVKNDHARHRLVGRAYVGMPYGFFQEYGTKRHVAQRFVRPTHAHEGPLAVRAMANILKS